MHYDTSPPPRVGGRVYLRSLTQIVIVIVGYIVAARRRIRHDSVVTSKKARPV